MAKSLPRIIVSRIIGFIISLILLIVANLLISVFNNNLYSEIVNFFNTNIILLFILALIGMINEIFWSFYFPFNLIAPISSSILSIYIITFIHRLFDFLNIYIPQNMDLPWQKIQLTVLLIVIIAGYLIILIRQGKPKEEFYEEIKNFCEEKSEDKKEKIQRKIEKINRKLGKKKIEWYDIGNEFKTLFYNIGKSFNNMFDKGKKKK